MTEELYLILGCFGRQDNGFVSCASVENRILKITSATEHYNDIMGYLDTCRLFDKPMFEMQAIRHFIFNMRERYDQVGAGRRLWDETSFTLYQKFLIDHRLCGLYVKLVLINPLETEPEPESEEKKIFIKGDKPFSKEPEEFPKESKLRLIRGRR
jgi:hypothetical protein